MFGQIYPWQTALWNVCAKQLAQHRLPHALLLRGYTGLGAEEFGRYLSCAVLCVAEEDGAAVRPCGQCGTCRLLERGDHPDFLLVEPPKTDAAIPVQAIREISDFLQITSHYGRGKVVLIPAAERMNRAAANSLLKILEEPPLGSLILLLSQWPSRLPVTVRSRCQTLNFTVPAAEETAQWLSAYMDDSVEEIIAKLKDRILPEYPLDAYAALYSDGEEKSIDMRKAFHQDCLKLIESRDLASVVEKWKSLPPQTVHGWLLEEIQAIVKKHMQDESERLLIDRLHKLYRLQVERYQNLPIALNPQLNLESALLEWRSAFVKRPPKLADKPRPGAGTRDR